MENILISVIVPVYKVERYLDECVESILAQTYRNLEVILVDDGSPDNCPRMCDAWAEKDRRVKVIHKENGGLSSARNAGLDIARGDYIGFVDSDDWIRSDMYEIMLGALKASDKKMACCSDQKTIETVEGEAGQIEELSIERALERVFRFEEGISVWRRLYEKTIFEGIRFPLGEVNEDCPILIPLTMRAGGMVHVRERLYYYRTREGSITATGWKTDDGIVLKNLKRMWRQLQDYELDCTESFRTFALNSLLNGAIVREKYIGELSDGSRAYLEESISILRRYFWKAIFWSGIIWKYKIFYILVVTRSLRPVYKLLGKS